MIERKQYMQKLREFKDINIVKIITGVRRCGKSTLLNMFVEELLKLGINPINIIKINFESIENEPLKNYKALYEHVKRLINPKEKTYLFFDEMQEVEGWQKAVNSFQVDFNVDIYITGSNAHLLSSEFATHLSGRYVEIKMLPLSFKEFVELYNFPVSMSKEEMFEQYIKFGGMPILKDLKFNETLVNDVLSGIYSTVILKDIIARNKTIDEKILSKIVLFLAQNIGSITSPNNITNVLASEGDMKKAKNVKTPVNRNTNKILNKLSDSFIFYPVRRYDIKGKQLLKTLEKYYIVDLGIRNMLIGNYSDRGHILENIIFLELLRRGYKVNIGKIKTLEVDFIAEKPGEKIYIQVTESLLSEDVRGRELEPLKTIKDFNERLVITLDRSYIDNQDGIKIVNAIDYLLN